MFHSSKNGPAFESKHVLYRTVYIALWESCEQQHFHSAEINMYLSYHRMSNTRVQNWIIVYLKPKVFDIL